MTLLSFPESLSQVLLHDFISPGIPWDGDIQSEYRRFMKAAVLLKAEVPE